MTVFLGFEVLLHIIAWGRQSWYSKRVLPHYKDNLPIYEVNIIGDSYSWRIPNFDYLSSIQISLSLITLKIPWRRDIEISVILTLQSWPLPMLNSFSLRKLTIWTTFTHVFFKISSVLTDSRNRKWESFGRSIPNRSIV